MKTKYYYIQLNESGGEVAKVPLNTTFEFIEEISGFSTLPFQFNIENGNLQDYQSNELSWLLFSKKMYSIIEEYSDYKFKWVTTFILNRFSNKEEPYFILCPVVGIDVLDYDKSILVGDDFIVKAVFDAAKIKNLKMFFVPGSSFRLVVNEEIKEKLFNCKCTGVEFTEASVTK